MNIKTHVVPNRVRIEPLQLDKGKEGDENRDGQENVKGGKERDVTSEFLEELDAFAGIKPRRVRPSWNSVALRL